MFKKTILLSLCFIKINAGVGPIFSDEDWKFFSSVGKATLISLPVICLMNNFLTKKYNKNFDYLKSLPIGGISLVAGLTSAIGVYLIYDKIFNKQNKK